MYDLNDLKSFVSVVETGNLSLSSKVLGVSKSTLSRRISHLEEVMRQPLMRRQANKMQANDAGKAFLPFARAILDTVRRAHRTVDELKETVSGHLNVGLFSGLSRSWATKELFEYLSRYPDVQIDVYTLTEFSDIRDQTDIALYMGELQESNLKAELLGEQTCSLYAHHSYLQRRTAIKRIEELEQHEWVNLHNYHANSSQLTLFHPEEGYQALQIPGSRLTTDLMGFHLDCIIHGRGIGILPDHMVEQRERYHPGELMKVLPEWQAPKLPLYLLSSYGHLPKRSQELIKQLKAAYKRSLA